MLKLDVGCGGSMGFQSGKVRGNVHCDIAKPTYKIPNFIQCDAHNLLFFKPSIFDVVFMIDVIEHVDSPVTVLMQIHRILRKSGVLKVGTPNALYLPKVIRSALRGKYSPHDTHVLTWGKAELENLLSKAGFESLVEYSTYYDVKKPWRYSLPVRICPFPSLKHRELLAVAWKK